MTTTNTTETQDNNLTISSNGNDSLVAISVSDLRKAVDGSASQNLPNFFLKSGLNSMHGERRGIQFIHPNINQTTTRKNPRTKPTFVEVDAWVLNIMLGERRGIHVIHHNIINTSAEKPIINSTVSYVQSSMESSLYALVIHYETMTASKDKGSHIYGLGSVCTFPNRQSLRTAPAFNSRTALVDNELFLIMRKTLMDHENLIVLQAQQSSYKVNYQPDRNNRKDRYQDIMVNMSLEHRGRMREEPDIQSSGKATAKNARKTIAAASTFRRGGSNSDEDGCNSKPQYPYLGQVRVLPDSADTSGQETPGLYESGPEPTFSRPGGESIPAVNLYVTTTVPYCYGWYVRRHHDGMRTTLSRETGYNIEPVIYDEGTTDVGFQLLPPTPGMGSYPSTTLESSSVPLLQEPVAEDTSRVTDAAPQDSPEQGAHLSLEEDTDKLVLSVDTFPSTKPFIEEGCRNAAMELCFDRKSHELPRRYYSSYTMTPDASTLTSEILIRLFEPEPTTEPEPETKYPTICSMSRRKALAQPEYFRTPTTTLPRTSTCVARLARRSRTA